MRNVYSDGQQSYGTTISSDSNSSIDFCIWILEVDGLQVFPFNQHSQDGDHSLRDRGMTSESWKQWLNKVVLLNDLNSYLPSINSNGDVEDRYEVEDTVKKFEEFVSRYLEFINQNPGLKITHPVMENFPNNFNLNKEAIREADREYQIWLSKEMPRRRRKAHYALKKLYGDNPLPNAQRANELSMADSIDLWDGEAAVKERLSELWAEYNGWGQWSQDNYDDLICMVRQSKASSLFSSFDYQDVYQAARGDDIQDHLDRIGRIQLHVVDYPSVVNYLVPPFSAIVSLPSAPVMQTWEALGYAERQITQALAAMDDE